MGCKQFSSDGLDWSKTLLQAPTIELPKPTVGRRQQPQNFPAMEPPVKCPRCHSTNTKFCYYNNYNKSQPRHFCKACKRHWTKGGILRNVPEGRGRKNTKRLKASKTSAKTAANKPCLRPSKGNIINRVTPQMVIQAQHQKNTSEIMSQPLINPPATVSQHNFTAGNDHNSIFLGSNFLRFPYSSSNFETNPFSISTSFIQTPDAFNFSSSGETMEDPVVTSILSNTSNALMPQPWQGPNSSYWNWDDLDTFAPTDFNMPWADSELKP